MYKILAIESSCDETAASVVAYDNGFKVCSNIIATQIETHKIYGGVVPEIASRMHIESISAVVDEALLKAEMTFDDIDAIAVTYAPGLVGALLVGVSYAKALASALHKPLIAVHHIEGHICANFLAEPDLKPPFVCLVASGGHSSIVKVSDYNKFEVCAKTRDDAAGEAFDKISRVLGFGYPGGPAIQKAAEKGDIHAFSFPKVSFADNDDFSFSGVKTAVINLIHKLEQKGENVPAEDIAASFQYCVCDVLASRLCEAAKKAGADTVALAGGVAANKQLRELTKEYADKNGMKLVYPPLVLCTDNAAMIGARAYFATFENNFAKSDLNAVATKDIM